MIPMTLAEIAEVVDGEVRGDPSTTVTGPAFVDSRAVEPGVRAEISRINASLPEMTRSF